MPQIMSLKKMALIFWLAVLLIPASLWAQRLEYVASYDSLTSPSQIMVRSNIAYVADWIRGLVALDISDLAHPVIIGQYHPQLALIRFDIKDTLACLATGISEPYSGRLDIISIADPAHPYLLASLSYPWEVIEVEIKGNYAYMYTYSSNHVIDISNPASPLDLGVFNAGGSVTDFESDNYLYAGLTGSAFSVMSLANPQFPSVIGSCPIPDIPLQIALNDSLPNFAYLADSDSGLKIINISDPIAPTLVASINLPTRAFRLAVQGSLAFVGGDTSLFVIDISQPDDLRLIDSYFGLGGVRYIGYADGYIYVSEPSGIEIFRLVPDVAEYAYIPGDVNNNGAANGIDVSYAVNFFKGGNRPPFICDCPNHDSLYAAGDVNGNCQFNGVDITYFVRYAIGGLPLRWCVDCPPISALRHDDFTGLCQQDVALDDSSYMTLEVIVDDLHIHHMDVTTQCCLEYFVEYNIRGFEIAAMERDIGPQCDCICPFDLESVAYDLAPGEYHVTLFDFWNQVVGSDTISVGGR